MTEILASRLYLYQVSQTYTAQFFQFTSWLKRYDEVQKALQNRCEERDDGGAIQVQLRELDDEKEELLKQEDKLKKVTTYFRGNRTIVMAFVCYILGYTVVH